MRRSSTLELQMRRLLRYQARLPNPLDHDFNRLGGPGNRVSKGAIGKLFAITQRAAAARFKRIEKRLMLVRQHPALRLLAGRDERHVVAALQATKWSESQAKYLWFLWWTTSPREAREQSFVRFPKRVLEEFLSESHKGRLGALAEGLRFLAQGRWGCLWGRTGHKRNPHSQGNRVTSRPEWIDTRTGERRPARKRPRA
jgi:hypothetical protein